MAESWTIAAVLRTLSSTIAAALVLLASAVQAFGAEPSAAALLLHSGDRIAGDLADSPQGDRLSWRAPGFLDDFEFPLKAVQAVRFKTSPALAPIDAEYLFELTEGDLFFGSIVSLNEQTVVIDSPGLGELRLARQSLARIERHSTSELVFSGLAGLDTWQVSGAADGWSEGAGHLLASKPQVSIYRDLKIPASARIEIDLAWTKKPNFELSFGAGRLPKAAVSKFQIDVWDDDLVAVCESEQAGDVAVMQSVGNGPGGVSLQVYLDRTNGKMLVTSADGTTLADLSTVPSAKPGEGGLQLTNRGSDLRLEKLRVYNWNAEPPQPMNASRSQIYLVDGTRIDGDISSYDSEQKMFTVKANDDEQSLAASQLQSVAYGAITTIRTGAVRVQMLNGTRVSGELLKIENGSLHLTCRGVEQPLVLPCSGMHGMTVLKPEDSPSITLGRTGRLEADGTLLHGSLVEVPRDNTTPAWRPLGATRGGRLAPDASARIVYRDPAPPAEQNSNAAPRVKRLAVDARVLTQLRKRAPEGGANSATDAAASECVLHLRSGDTIHCSEVVVDERGVHFKSSVSDATFLPHAQVKVLELMPNATAVQVAKSKKQRLLTLPRMQRDSPPTQLLRAANGDYLRARLVAMDARQLQVEMQLEIKTLPRDSVARIIWLHADELDPQATAPPPADAPPGIRVQAIPRDGNRLTFYSDRFAAATLSGRSEVLGNCHVKIGEIDELLIGSAIEKSAAQLAFHQWRLSRAIDPLEFQENSNEAGGSTEGLESSLVGKPAPDISLKLLDGEMFRLSEQKDKVLVVDFWASWCGPCLQTIPQIEQVVREFADQRVELIAVNLQETPEQIRSALERLQLSMTVALDRDGRVAERYGATAIPQTVIIGRDGKVARLFVGGGARFGEQLRGALKDVLAKPDEPPAAQP